MTSRWPGRPWRGLRLRAYEKAGKPVTERGLRRRAKLLDVATHPQAWLYRSLWARGDIQFLDERSCQI